MFLNIFFLMVMLILIAIGSENTIPLFTPDVPVLVVSLAIALYFFTLILIYSQIIRLGWITVRLKSKMLVLTNIELFIFFIAYYFIFGVDHLFHIKNFLFADSFLTIFSLILYFGGLAVFHYAQNKLQNTVQQAFAKMQLQLSFYIPFLLPFLIYKILSDLTLLVPWEYLRHITGITENSSEESFIFFLLGLSFAVTMILIMPHAVVQCWRCQDLKDSVLKDRLTSLCQKADFKYTSLKTWDTMQDFMTAAIIGIWRRSRYVIFTLNLLRRLTPEAIEAILAHEIGHSKSKHLLIYPFIIGGILLVGNLLTYTLYPQVMAFFQDRIALSLETWKTLGYLIFFIIFTTLLAIMFRLVFGYFSRLFERQADLYVFKLNLPSAYLIEAFDEIAIASGNIHDTSNWHHYSIRQRINFLKNVEKNSSLINIHHRKVVLSLLIYFSCLGGLLYFIFFIH